METLFPSLLGTDLTFFRQVFSQSGFRYFCGFVVGLLIATGRRTARRLSVVCFWVDRSASSWERFLSQMVYNNETLTKKLIELLTQRLAKKLIIARHCVIALDSTIIEKAAKMMIGIQKWSQSNQSQIGHHWMIGALLYRNSQRILTFPVVGRLIFGPASRAGFIANREGEVRAQNFFDAALAVVVQIAEAITLAPPLVVADAYFAKAWFQNRLTRRSIGLLTRLRRDAVGFWEPVYCGRGRKPKRGRHCKLGDWLHEFPLQTAKVTVYGRQQQVNYVSHWIRLRNVEQRVRVIVVQTAKQPLILSTNCHALTIEEAIEIYAARFAIELAIRELKGEIGISQYQARTPIAFIRFFQLGCISFVVGKLWQMNRASEANADSDAESLGEIRRQLRGELMGRWILRKFARGADKEKCQTDIEPILRLAA